MVVASTRPFSRTLRRPAARAVSCSLACGLAVALLLAAPGHAATIVWIGNDGLWEVASNWSLFREPLTADDVQVTSSDATDRTITYQTSAGPALLTSILV